MQNFRNNVSFYNREHACGCEHQTPRSQMNAPVNTGMAKHERPMDNPCRRNDPIENMPLAMAYVPWQRWQNIAEADKGFHCGTIFNDLRKPFEHAGGGCR